MYCLISSHSSLQLVSWIRETILDSVKTLVFFQTTMIQGPMRMLRWRSSKKNPLSSEDKQS